MEKEFNEAVMDQLVASGALKGWVHYPANQMTYEDEELVLIFPNDKELRISGVSYGYDDCGALIEVADNK